MRLETLMWQQHVVTIRPDTLVVARTVDFTTVTGEDISFNVSRLVWISKEGKNVRVCYNRKVAISGVSQCKQGKSLSNGLVEFKQGKTTLLVNPNFHKRYRE